MASMVELAERVGAHTITKPGALTVGIAGSAAFAGGWGAYRKSRSQPKPYQAPVGFGIVGAGYGAYNTNKIFGSRKSMAIKDLLSAKMDGLVGSV